jgi:type IV pilus assembly protein PilM
MGKPVFFGLDVSDRSVDLVSLIRKGGKIVVDRYGRADLPVGAIDRGVLQDVDAVARVVTELLATLYGEDRPRRYNGGIALPETQIFSKIFRLPSALTPEQTAQAAEQEARDVFPIDLRLALKESLTVHREKEFQDVYFAAVHAKVLQAYADLAARCGITPLFFDSEAISMARALTRPEDPPTLIVDIGARSTTLSVAEEGGIRLTSDIAIAGNQLTAAIEAKLGVPLAEAEKLKRMHGFDPNAKDDRVFFLLQAPMREIIDEIRRVLDYYARKTGHPVARVLLTGGGSLTPFTADYLASNLPGVPISVANPLEKVHIDDSELAGTFHATATMHTAAIGLALRAIGVTTHPQVTFLIEKQRTFGGTLTGLFKGIGERFTSMSPRTKKTSPHKKEVKKTEEEPEPVVPSPAASSPTPAPAPAPAAPAPASITASATPITSPEEVQDDSVLAQLSPAIEASKSLHEDEPATAVDGGGLANVAPPTNEQLYVEQLTGQHKRAQGEVDEGDLYHGAAPTSGVRPREPRRQRTGTLLLVVLVLILAAAAIAGVTMFLKKNDMLDSLLARFRGGDAPAALTTDTTPSAPESVAATFRLAAAGSASEDEGVVRGRILETEVSAKDSFPVTGTKPSVGGKAKGTVTITNRSSTAYSFIPTTRVLSKDGVLFRLDAQTAIPANGSVTAAVTADVAGPTGDIGPSEFTIPGLGPSFTTVITATSGAAMVGGAGGDVPAVSVDDLVQAKDALQDKVLAEAAADFDALRNENEQVNVALYEHEETSFDAPDVGAPGTSFDAELTLGVKVLTIPEEEVNRLLDAAFAEALPDDGGAHELGARVYYVVAYDTEAGIAEIRVEAPIRAAE